MGVEYKVIEESNHYDLMKKVNLFMPEWQPVGGVSVFHVGVSLTAKSRLYYQAMVKSE